MRKTLGSLKGVVETVSASQRGGAGVDEGKTRLFGCVEAPDHVPNSEFQSICARRSSSPHSTKCEETGLFGFYTYGGVPVYHRRIYSKLKALHRYRVKTLKKSEMSSDRPPVALQSYA
jgi:hypothetical protein